MTVFKPSEGNEVTLDIDLGAVAANAGGLSKQQDQAVDEGGTTLGLFGVRGKLTCQVKTGAVAPTAGGTIEFFLVRGGRSDGTAVDNDLGLVKVAVATSQDNVEHIGSIVVTNTANKVWKKTFFVENWSRFYAVLGFNGTDQAFATSNGDHSIHFQPTFISTV